MSSSLLEAPQTLTLEAIDTGLPLVEAKDRPDIQDQFEREDYEAARLRNKLARSKIKNVKSDRQMRKQYAGRILRYLEWYSSGVGLLLLLNGFKFLGFSLEKEVAATLVGSTAIAAIGLVGFIAKGLFQAPPENSN